MTVHVRNVPRPRPRSAQAPCPAVSLTAPTLSGGDDLGPFAVQVRRTIQLGALEMLVDEAACAAWSPGQLLVLEHLRRLAQRCGTAWTAWTAREATGEVVGGVVGAAAVSGRWAL